MKAIFYPTIVLRSCLLATVFILVGAITSFATHLRAGNITVTKTSGDCASPTYIITIKVYTKGKDNTTVLFGGEGDYLDFGDGSPLQPVPEQSNIVIDAALQISYAEYTVEHTYAGAGQYKISYVEKNRNGGVLNMTNSLNTPFYLETVLKMDPFLGCSTPAELLVDPIDFACPGVTWTHNPGAYDPDGDSISFEMVIPKQGRNQNVFDYRDPNSADFYQGLTYGESNEAGDGPPTFSINSVTGTITWDAPGNVGEYNIAFNIVEWRFKDGVWYRMGHVRRDMQIIVMGDCKNNRPELEIPYDTCIVAEEILKADIFAYDLLPKPPAPQKLDDVKIQAFSEIFKNPPTANPVATVTPSNVFLPSEPKDQPKMKFVWATNCDHIRRQPYQVVFKATDKRNQEASLATFKTWMIKVVAPAPEWNNATVDLNRRATLNWEPYLCGNAQRMEIWRRVDSVSFKPDNCQTGMPGYLGYEKIGEVLLNTGSGPVTQYIDTNKGKGLSQGAGYCYRLVAKFALPRGGESYVSKDICIDPIPAAVPIITNVSVKKTGVSDGEIEVIWTKPFDSTVPLPYYYEVYRGSGFVRSDSILVATLPTENDLSFVDTGINTDEKVYNYSVVAYSTTTTAKLGNSPSASSVRLDTKSQVNQIELNWSAIVPWSNLLQSTPTKNFKHVIYRGPEGTAEGALIEIATVDATTDGLVYVDAGQWDGNPLDNSKTYCYRVETKGGYGNPNITEPLINSSQMVCVQPGDDQKPCVPPLFIQSIDCKQYTDSLATCAGNAVSNTIYWNPPDDPICRADIKSYNIYRSNAAGGEDYTLIKTGHTETVYHDNNLPTFAWCYKIKAVDRSGNESEFSNEVCNDNCPYYELPNVFSPNEDFYNDVFSAYSNFRRGCVEGKPCLPVSEESQKKCARFVEKVKFKVLNRWGQEVYTYQSGGDGSEKTIYIDWDGRDNNGSRLTPAVYYYIAEVTFDVLRPSDKVKIYKGWVHLLDDSQ